MNAWSSVGRCVALCLAAGYFIAAAGKHMIIHTSLTHDSQLFLKLGLSIGSGHWLGDYNELTLIKGIGYPVFLAVGHLAGIPVNVFQAAFYFTACYFLSATVYDCIKSYALFWSLLAVLLLLPPMYDAGASSNILREYFYSAVVVFFVTSLFRLLFFDPQLLSYASAAFLGVSLAAVWLTREEGLWILPGFVVMLILAYITTERSALRYKAILFMSGMFVFALLVCLVGLTNRIVYGRFSINETTEPPFQTALVALQRASYPYWKPYVAIPREARLRVYEVSSTFAELKNFFDPVNAPTPWQFGCGQLPETCGDIVGSLFPWALREAGKTVGAYTTANNAADFYARLAHEIQSGCNSQELRCASYLPPIIPPFTVTPDQIFAFPKRVLRVLSYFTMLRRVNLEPDYSHIDGSMRDEVLEFLNYPPHLEPVAPIKITAMGWYYREGQEWFSINGNPSILSVTLVRDTSPDVAQHFSDPLANQQRFRLEVGCQKEPCDITIEDGHGVRREISLTAQPPKAWHVGFEKGVLYVDSLSVSSGPSSIAEGPSRSEWRQSFQQYWLSLIGFVQPIYTALAVFGTLSYLIVAFWSAPNRGLRLLFFLASSLAVMTLSRFVLLALLEGFSFPIYYGYALPAIPLEVAFATVSIYLLISYRRPSAVTT
jgi:hypothetical protein